MTGAEKLHSSKSSRDVCHENNRIIMLENLDENSDRDRVLEVIWISRRYFQMIPSKVRSSLGISFVRLYQVKKLYVTTFLPEPKFRIGNSFMISDIQFTCSEKHVKKVWFCPLSPSATSV